MPVPYLAFRSCFKLRSAKLKTTSFFYTCNNRFSFITHVTQNVYCKMRSSIIRSFGITPTCSSKGFKGAVSVSQNRHRPFETLCRVEQTDDKSWNDDSARWNNCSIDNKGILRNMSNYTKCSCGNGGLFNYSLFFNSFSSSTTFWLSSWIALIRTGMSCE